MGAVFELTISAELAERIRAHGVETYPHECCGALLGRDAQLVKTPEGEDREAPRSVVKLFPLANSNGLSPRNRFMVTPEDVLRADVAARNDGLEVVGWYHSHPDHPARPSEFDREHAWPWYSYIIVSVHNRVPQDMTSWRLNDDRLEYSAEQIKIRQHALP
jgi:proteasome lid subunit RPN8/RPN11